MNVWTGSVRVVTDCEVRYGQSGKAVASVRLVADSGFGDNKKPLWVTGVFFGKRAEGGLPGMLEKGKQAIVSGEISMKEWEDKNGNKQKSLEIMLDKIELVGGQRQGGGQAGGDQGFEAPPMESDIPF